VLRLRTADQGPLAAERRRPVVARELSALLVLPVRSCGRRVHAVRASRPSAVPPRLPQVCTGTRVDGTRVILFPAATVMIPLELRGCYFNS